ncbi:MAG: tyrosine-type recombinase/integrase [Melioribacteraceae bacterium]|nr:tyrosine-type recombinase/integrase [Melioribacteraceae bacterium]
MTLIIETRYSILKIQRGKESDSLPLYEELENFLTSEFPNIKGKIVPYKDRSSFKFFRRFLEKEGYPHYTLHELRKTFISRLVNSGKFSIFDIQKIARHKDIRTTQKSYIELDMKRIGTNINDVFLRTMKHTISEKVTNKD